VNDTDLAFMASAMVIPAGIGRRALLGGSAQPLELSFPGAHGLVIAVFRLVDAAGEKDHPAGRLLERPGTVLRLPVCRGFRVA
jgi:hypothetical protein